MQPAPYTMQAGPNGGGMQPAPYAMQAGPNGGAFFMSQPCLVPPAASSSGQSRCMLTWKLFLTEACNLLIF